MALARGGVIILDDCFHEGWPGVSDGVHPYFLRSRGIVLFATGGNKTLFCAPQYAPGYTAALLPVGIKVRRQTFLGRSVVYLDFIPFNCAERIGSTEAWKAVKNVPPLPALRRMYRQRVIW
jgi:hypothetical protein